VNFWVSLLEPLCSVPSGITGSLAAACGHKLNANPHKGPSVTEGPFVNKHYKNIDKKA
jgi:hypothetical protein